MQRLCKDVKNVLQTRAEHLKDDGNILLKQVLILIKLYLLLSKFFAEIAHPDEACGNNGEKNTTSNIKVIYHEGKFSSTGPGIVSIKGKKNDNAEIM